MKQSGFMERLNAVRREEKLVTERITRQVFFDSLVIVMNTDFKWGYERIMKLKTALEKEYDFEIEGACGGDEADYIRAKVDEALTRICRRHQEIIPYEERFPELREYKTVKEMK